jgi:hypothetical protein
MDPQLAWDAVEASERRKDSQLAHDFRVPVPYGLSDVDAIAMARRIAQRICDDLHTFVFVGVHRDSGVDAMGIAKPRDRVGFHAHIYFPTRRFVFKADEAEASDADDSAAGSGSWGMGEKLRVLSNKATAAACLERFNAEWAAAANHFAAAAGQVPDFSHLSYARLGLAKLPQPTLGAAATALERRGVATRKGDAIRAARVDVASVSARAMDRLAASHAVAVAAASGNRSWMKPIDPIVARMSVLPSPREPVVTTPVAGLAARFLAELDSKPELPQPLLQQRGRLVEWLGLIEQALRTLAALAARILDLGERRRRDDGARATFAIEVDDRRRQRAEARRAVSDWLNAHPWQVRLARSLGGEARKPVALVELEGMAASLNHEVQQLKRGTSDAEQRVASFDNRLTTAKQEQRSAEHQLEASVQAISTLEPLYTMLLLSVADVAHTPMLTRAMPMTQTVIDDIPSTVPNKVEVQFQPEQPRGVRPVL